MDTPELDYDAICIDTCIYDEHGDALERGVLKQLEQFRDSPVRLLVPEIVHNELRQHLIERTENAQAKVKEAVNAATKELGAGVEATERARDLLNANSNAHLIVDARLSRFYERTNATRISSTEVSVAQLEAMYFSALPPFAKAGKKKSEFPDAISLLSLSAFAKRRGWKVLVVSADRGWQNYCAESDQLDVVERLADALSHFQLHISTDIVAKKLRDALRSIEDTELIKTLRSAIQDNVENASVDAHASSVYYLDELESTASYVSHSFRVAKGGEPEIYPLRVSSAEIVFEIVVSIQCELVSSYRLSMRDPIDGDYINLGPKKLTAPSIVKTEVVLSLEGSYLGNLEDMKIKSIEIPETHISFDFGNIDFDPDSEGPF